MMVVGLDAEHRNDTHDGSQHVGRDGEPPGVAATPATQRFADRGFRLSAPLATKRRKARTVRPARPKARATGSVAEKTVVGAARGVVQGVTRTRNGVVMRASS